MSGIVRILHCFALFGTHGHQKRERKSRATVVKRDDGKRNLKKGQDFHLRKHTADISDGLILASSIVLEVGDRGPVGRLVLGSAARGASGPDKRGVVGGLAKGCSIVGQSYRSHGLVKREGVLTHRQSQRFGGCARRALQG